MTSAKKLISEQYIQKMLKLYNISRKTFDLYAQSNYINFISLFRNTKFKLNANHTLENNIKLHLR